MHDLDRTLQELQPERFEFEFEFEENEWNEVLSENELNELASELLEVTQEQELEQFLGSLVKKVGRAVGKIARSPIGNALGGMLKGLAKKALPMAGAALGNIVAPGLGGAIGGKLGSMAGQALGLELEGLSQEDAEFEVAKQFVRVATDASRSALTKPESLPPVQVARQAIAEAIQKHAPGMAAAPAGRRGGAKEGRWAREGNRIVVYGA